MLCKGLESSESYICDELKKDSSVIKPQIADSLSSDCTIALQNDTSAITRNIRFGEDRRHDPYSLQVAVEAIRRKQSAFIDQLEDLRETVNQSRGRINKARTVVLVRILENCDIIFRQGI